MKKLNYKNFMRGVHNLLIAIGVLVIVGCNNKADNNNLYNSLSFLDKDRIIYYNSDSIALHPFEHFNIVKFETVEAGAFENPYVKLKITDTIQSIKLNSGEIIKVKVLDSALSFEAENDNSKYEYPYSNVSSVQYKFKTDEVPFFRTIEKGKTYKIIYVYQSDIEYHRIDPPSDAYNDGYIILDIVPVEEKFEREKGKTMSYEFKYNCKIDTSTSMVHLEVTNLKNKQTAFKTDIKLQVYNTKDFGKEITSFYTGYGIQKEFMDGYYGDLVIADINFDNLEDFAIKVEDSNTGSIYEFYLQDRNQKFVKDKFLSSELSHFPDEINNGNNTLVRRYHVGANEVYEDTFIYNKNSNSFSKNTRQIM